MKNLLLLIAFFSPQIITAQVEFAPLGATWYYDYDIGAPWKLGYAKVEVTGIDTIQGRACKRIESKNMFGNNDWGCSFYAPLLQTYQENGRVYAYHDGDFHLLYDFDAVAGESWVIHNPPLVLGDSLVVVVDSVSFISVGSQTLKVQHVTNPGLQPGWLLEWGSEIVEGIGNTGYITPQWPACDPWIFGLRCYQDDSLDLHFVSYPCDSVKLLTSTKEPTLQVGLFSPNPVLDNIVALSEGFEADRVVLMSVLGTLQKTFLLDGRRVLELGDDAPGIYFVAVFQGSRLVGSDKLVIHRR